MEAAMPHKLRTKKRPNKLRETDNETKGTNKIQQYKACMHREGSWIHEKAVGKNSAWRSRWSYCWKGVQFVESSQSGARVLSFAPSDENPGCKRSSGQILGEARKVASMANDQGKEQTGGHPRRTKSARNCPFCRVISKMRSWNRSIKKYRPGFAPRWYCEIRFRIVCCFYRARFVCVTNDGRKSNVCHCKTWLCRTSSRRSIRLHPNKSGERSKIPWTNQSQTVLMGTSSTTQVAHIMVKHSRPSGSSREKVVLELWWEKVSNFILSQHVDDIL